MKVHQQYHGYVSGHQLLASSVRLVSHDQAIIDRLSDLSASLEPGEKCPPYLTGYPLPSGAGYVLARTRYDAEAPRAGCVLTHSLILDLNVWAALRSPASVTKLHRSFDRHGRSSLHEIECDIDAEYSHTKIAVGASSLAFMEAFLLGQEKSIAWFGLKESDAAALRLLDALWASARLDFAFCTFAPKPRRLDDRDFNILLAPAAARSRYTNWSGLRIGLDMANAEDIRAPGYIAWLRAVSKSVFEDAKPHLDVDDSLGLLERNQPNALRLSLLWSDLSARSSSTPDAYLGLLDILASSGLSEHDVLKRAEPILQRAATHALKLDAYEGLQLLELLVEKIPDLRPAPATLRAIERSVADLVRLAPEEGIRLANRQRGAARKRRALLRGAGIGLSFADNLPQLLDEASDEVLLEFAALSREFCLTLFGKQAEGTAQALLGRLARLLDMANPTIRRRVRQSGLGAIWHPAFAPIVRTLLRDVHPGEAFAVSKRVLASHADNPKFFGRAISSELGVRYPWPVVEAFAEILDRAIADELIVGTIPTDGDGLLFLTHSERFDAARMASLAGRKMSSLGDSNLKAWLSSMPREHERLARLLRVGDELSNEQLARVLTSLRIEPPLFSEALQELLETLSAETAATLAEVTLHETCWKESTALLPALGLLMATPAGIHAAHRMGQRLVDCIAPRRVRLDTGGYGGELLREVMFAPSSFRRPLIDRIDELSSRLCDISPWLLGREGYRHWGEMLVEADSLQVRTTANAASRSLRFVFNHAREPVSALLPDAFKLAYREALLAEAPSLVVHFLFGTWDKAAEMREDLVSTFQRSCWPASDLAVAANKAGIMRYVVDRLSATTAGSRALDQAEVELEHQDVATEGSSTLVTLRLARASYK